jgi:hypothetical protein
MYGGVNAGLSARFYTVLTVFQNLFSSMLYPFGDDCHCCYITKMRKRTDWVWWLQVTCVTKLLLVHTNVTPKLNGNLALTPINLEIIGVHCH